MPSVESTAAALPSRSTAPGPSNLGGEAHVQEAATNEQERVIPLRCCRMVCVPASGDPPTTTSAPDPCAEPAGAAGPWRGVAVAAFGRTKPLPLPLVCALHGLRSLYPPPVCCSSSAVPRYLHYLKGSVCSLRPSSPPRGAEAVLYLTAGADKLLRRRLYY